MIKSILKGILKLILSLLKMLLVPINAVIVKCFPQINDFLTSIAQMLSYILKYMGFIIEVLGISDVAIYCVVVTLIFGTTVTMSVNGAKIALKWYRMLMP